MKKSSSVKKKSPVKRKLEIDQATVDAFSKKLKEWSKTLSQEERDLVRLLVDRATEVNIGDLGSYNFKVKIRAEAEKLFKALKTAVQSSPAVGVILDPEDLWLKSTTTGRSPDWTQADWDRSAPEIIVDLPSTLTKGGGNQ